MICDGCKKMSETGRCLLYGKPPHIYLSHGGCPHNMVLKEEPKRKVRVGQQKQKKGWRR
jgi:hypothetical protein